MATGYDVPRKRNEETPEESLEELKSRRRGPGDAVVDEDEGGAADSFELPGAGLSNEELSVRVVPGQDDGFVCFQCLMVHHASQPVYEEDGRPVCVECAGQGYTGKSEERIKPPTGEEEAWACFQGKTKQKIQLI